jgi:hypothetical protein
MANKTIPLNDREVVIQRLAEGQSTRKAIQGTAIASNQTAARIARAESHRITQYRQDYLAAIDKWTGHPEHRARLLAQMLDATKSERIAVNTKKLRDYPMTSTNYVYAYVEDWDTRLKAIKYIDQLVGIVPMQGGTHVNVLQQIKG